MAKTFNVDQLRINGSLLTGNAEGTQLYYDGQQLAQGGSAVPSERELTAGTALKWEGTTAQAVDLSSDRQLNVQVDDSTIKVNISDETLYVNEIGYANLSTDVAGDGLLGGKTAAISVGAGTGIHVEGNNVNIEAGGSIASPAGIITSMLNEDCVTNEKLAQITEGNKVAGSAVQLYGTSLYNETSAGNGLAVKAAGITATHLNASVAGTGLAGGAGTSLHVDIATNSGLGFSASDELGVKNLGISNAMLAGSIANGKLLTLNTAPDGAGNFGVYGAAIKREGDTLGVANNGLKVNTSGITYNEINPDVAGSGLIGGHTVGLAVNAGSGINVGGADGTDDKVNIAEGGVVKSMLHADALGDSKWDSSDKLAVGNTQLTAGDGLNLSTNTLSVNQGDGMTIDAGGLLRVNNTVVRTTGTQSIDGLKTFLNDCTFDSGVLVKGDFEVRGTINATVSNEVNIGDSIIVLNDDYPSAGTTPPNAGIEIERGAADGGSAGSKNAFMVYDDDTTNKWACGIKNNLHVIHTKEFTRTFSVEVASGVNTHAVDWSSAGLGSHTFESVPNIVVSLQHTGKYSVSNPDLLGSMVTQAYTTGCHVDFTANTPNSGYYLNVHVSTL